jgi:LysM repeat protein
MLRPMAGRRPARFLAPLALIAVGIALLMVLKANGGSTSGGQPASSAGPAATATATPRAKTKRKTYVVKPGDTPSQIAERTGVTLEQLEKANPSLDPQLLAPGQRIKIPQ